MKLSIVATLYHSAPYINEFHARSKAAAEQLVGEDFEIILVNDGSPDNSLELAVALTEHHSNVVVVDLSRNFGHHNAMMAGLSFARGERVFLIDSDLEEDPGWLTQFDSRMNADLSDVVYGVQESRKGNWFERLSGAIFYTLFNYLAKIEHPRNPTTARLMTRRYVLALLRFVERELVISCLWVITGYKQSSFEVKKLRRSPTTYSLAKKIALATNAITSFSEVPLRLIFYSGVVIFLGSIIYVGYLAFIRLVRSTVPDGWTSVMASVWLIGGIVIMFLGLLGIYVSKIFSESKQRPSFIVRQIYGQSSSN
jgi:putative glycosyltransferase